jgi:hypothetical protein
LGKKISNEKFSGLKAIEYCENRTTGNYSDWKSPTKNQLETLIDKSCETINENCSSKWINKIFDVEKEQISGWTTGGLWTSTEVTKSKSHTNHFYYLIGDTGKVRGYGYKDALMSQNYVICVRK